MRLRRAPHVAWRRVGDETVLIHLRNKRLYVLNPSGGFFWHQLDGLRESSELLSKLPGDSEVPHDAGARVERFLSTLHEADLVEPRTETDDGLGELPLASYPFETFVPPELVWQEDIRNFGQSCAFIGGASAACDTIPTT